MTFTRRRLLGTAAVVALAGCSRTEPPRPAPAGSSAPPPPFPSPPSSSPERHERLAALERRYAARLGVFALDTGSGATIEHRPDERFAFCSTFKAVAAAAVLARHPASHLDTVVRYDEDDLLRHSPVTRRHVTQGMTIRRLCDAAIRYSDGTAGNLLVRDLGGPAQLTAFVRGLGDPVTRMDRIEPAITTAVPGDPRDTTSPRAFGGVYRQIVLGDAVPPAPRAFLRDLLDRNTTGDRRIRAGLPDGWVVADKTGTGSYGTANDIAVVWPPGSAPLVVAVMSSKAMRTADADERLLADAAAYVAEVFRR